MIDDLAGLEAVRSIDEFQVALRGPFSERAAAMENARLIKAAIRERGGSELRCSIGIGPNPLLAKIAGKLEKPDGLAWLAPENMPDRIAHLKLGDLPGLSRGMTARLNHAAVWGIRELYALDPRHARQIWRSVEGERFVRALHGMDIPLPETRRSGYGNSKVLAPQDRTPEAARLVGRQLVEKAVGRLRRDGWCARRFSLFLHFSGQRSWRARQTCSASQDTRLFLSIFEGLWATAPAGSPGGIVLVGVHLGNLIPLSERSVDLFLQQAPGRKGNDERLSEAVDRLNRRYGRRVVTFGVHDRHTGLPEQR